MKEAMSYEAALAELQAIIEALQTEQVSLDELAARSRRAAELLQFCRSRLRQTEAELGKLFEEDGGG